MLPEYKNILAIGFWLLAFGQQPTANSQ